MNWPQLYAYGFVSAPVILAVLSKKGEELFDRVNRDVKGNDGHPIAESWISD